MRSQKFKLHVKKIALQAISGLRILKILNPLTQGCVSIFMHHRMENVDGGIRGHSAAAITKALEYLRRNKYNVISLEEAFLRLDGDMPPLKNAVAFTFDDGYFDQAEIAIPLFQNYDCPVTIFLITGFLDGELWPWDARAEYIFSTTQRDTLTLPTDAQSSKYQCQDTRHRINSLRRFIKYAKSVPQDQIDEVINSLSLEAGVEVYNAPPSQYRPLSWDQARQLEKTGTVRFGPHSVTHRILSRLSAENSRYEICESWNRLRAELHNPLPIFCYPTGRAADFGQREVDTLRELNFLGAVTAQAGYANLKTTKHEGSDKYMMPRFAFPECHYDFIQYSSGIEKTKELLRAGGLRKLIS